MGGGGVKSFDVFFLFVISFSIVIVLSNKRKRGPVPVFIKLYPVIKTCHQRVANETPFKLRFAGGPMMARH